MTIMTEKWFKNVFQLTSIRWPVIGTALTARYKGRRLPPLSELVQTHVNLLFGVVQISAHVL